MTPFSLRDSNQRTACARSVRVSPTRLLSSLQGASLSQQHRPRCHRIQGPYHQYPQVPTVSLVPCPTLLNTVPTHFTHDETQRVATKTRFLSTPLSEMMAATLFPSQRNVLSPLTLIPDAQRIKTMLTSVTRDHSSRRRELKVASHKP